MFNRPHLSAILLILPLFSCSQSAPSTPVCRVQSEIIIDSISKSAGCIIPIAEKVLLIQHRLSGRLDIPGGGQNDGESLACAAHRETWEETGLNVVVGELVAHTSNGMALFACSQDAGYEALPNAIAAPAWATLEVKGLVKVKPFDLDDDKLRFKDDLVPLLDGFVAASAGSHELKSSGELSKDLKERQKEVSQ